VVGSPGFEHRTFENAKDQHTRANQGTAGRTWLIKRQTIYLSWNNSSNGRQKGRGLAPTLATCPYHMTVQRKFWRAVPSIARTVNNAWPVGLLTSHMTRGLLLFRGHIVITISHGAYAHAKRPGVIRDGGLARSLWARARPQIDPCDLIERGRAL